VTVTQHTTSEAVQYWYDAAVERREERDRLRAVVSRIRQMTDAWEQRLPEVVRTPAVVSAIRAALEPASSAGRAPAAERAGVRAAALREGAVLLEAHASTLELLSSSDYDNEAFAASHLRTKAAELRRMAGEAPHTGEQP
jgi:hypothetical protein